MSNETDTLFSLAHNIAKRPQMYASTPDAAHGLIEAISWVILHQLSGQPIERCMKESRKLIQNSTLDIGRSRTNTPLLCHDSFPDGASTFEAFRNHASLFVESLLEKVMLDKTVDNEGMNQMGESS